MKKMIKVKEKVIVSLILACTVLSTAVSANAVQGQPEKIPEEFFNMSVQQRIEWIDENVPATHHEGIRVNNGQRGYLETYYGVGHNEARMGEEGDLLGEMDIQFPTHQPILEKKLNSFRIYMHYEKNHMFLKENQLLHDISKIAKIPLLIFHNRLDFCCPLYQAFDLHQAHPKSRLLIVADKGHGSKKFFKIMKETLKNENSR